MAADQAAADAASKTETANKEAISTDTALRDISRRRQRRAGWQPAGGRRDTILTSPLGTPSATGDASTAVKTILGA